MNETETITIINQLKEVFAPIAQKIGEGTEFGWEIILRQQIVIGVINLLVAILGIILLYFTYRIIRYSMKKCEEDSCSDWGIIGGIIGLVGGIASLFMIICGMADGISHLINPAYYAIEFLIKLVK